MPDHPREADRVPLPEHLFEDGSAIWAPIMEWAGENGFDAEAADRRIALVAAIDNAIRDAMRAYADACVAAAVAQERAKSPQFAGWFSELKSGMCYRLWEQGGHERQPGEVALFTRE